MKALIQHLVRNNWPEISAKSCRNCHVEGVDSIMLLEAPGKTIRLFVANGSHNLHRNFRGSGPMSVAFHAHHCSLTILCVYGAVLNRTMYAVENGGEMSLNAFRYRSALRGEAAGFDLSHRQRVILGPEKWLSMGDQLWMPASSIHTVAVSEGHRSAWLVFEGIEDPNYVPECYSDADLEQVDVSNLYQPISESDIKSQLAFAGLY